MLKNYFNIMGVTKKYTIGIDIGGTNMKAILWNGEKIIMDYSLGTPKDNIKHLIIMLRALIAPLIEKANGDNYKVKGIGLSVAGIHDFKNKKIDHSPNIEILNGSKIGELLSKEIKLPVKMDNDANCFIRAEAKIGIAQKFNNCYGIIISTGIGGAWWLNKKVYRGSHGVAGEPGGMIADFTDMVKLEDAYHKLNQNNSLNLATEAYRGDILAKRAYEEIGKLLGVSLANIANIIDPEAFILNGGTLESSDLFLSELKKEMKLHLSSPAKNNIKILKSKLGKDAGAIGAALLIA